MHPLFENQCWRSARSVRERCGSCVVTSPRQEPVEREWLTDAQTSHCRIQALMPGYSALGHASKENDGSGCYGPTLLLRTLRVDRNLLGEERDPSDLS